MGREPPESSGRSVSKLISPHETLGSGALICPEMWILAHLFIYPVNHSHEHYYSDPRIFLVTWAMTPCSGGPAHVACFLRSCHTPLLGTKRTINITI